MPAKSIAYRSRALIERMRAASTWVDEPDAPESLVQATQLLQHRSETESGLMLRQPRDRARIAQSLLTVLVLAAFGWSMTTTAMFISSPSSDSYDLASLSHLQSWLPWVYFALALLLVPLAVLESAMAIVISMRCRIDLREGLDMSRDWAMTAFWCAMATNVAQVYLGRHTDLQHVLIVYVVQSVLYGGAMVVIGWIVNEMHRYRMRSRHVVGRWWAVVLWLLLASWALPAAAKTFAEDLIDFDWPSIGAATMVTVVGAAIHGVRVMRNPRMDPIVWRLVGIDVLVAAMMGPLGHLAILTGEWAIGSTLPTAPRILVLIASGAAPNYALEWAGRLGIGIAGRIYNWAVIGPGGRPHPWSSDVAPSESASDSNTIVGDGAVDQQREAPR